MKSVRSWIKAALVAGSVTMVGCIHETLIQGASVKVQVLESDILLGNLINVKFTNTGPMEIFLQSRCGAIKRKYGAEWRTPESLIPLHNCNSVKLAMQRVSPGQSITEEVPMWGSTQLTTDLTGEFRLSYVYSESIDPQAPRFQVTTVPFVVRTPSD